MKTLLHSLLSVLLVLGCLVLFPSCKDDDSSGETQEQPLANIIALNFNGELWGVVESGSDGDIYDRFVGSMYTDYQVNQEDNKYGSITLSEYYLNDAGLSGSIGDYTYTPLAGIQSRLTFTTSSATYELTFPPLLHSLVGSVDGQRIRITGTATDISSGKSFSISGDYVVKFR